MDTRSSQDDQYASLLSEIRQQEKALSSLLNVSKEEKNTSHSQLSKTQNNPSNLSNTQPSETTQPTNLNNDNNQTKQPQIPIPGSKKDKINFLPPDNQGNAFRSEYDDLLKGLQSFLEEEDPTTYPKLPSTALTGGDNRKRSNHILKRPSAFSNPSLPQTPPPKEPTGCFTPPLRHKKDSETLSLELEPLDNQKINASNNNTTQINQPPIDSRSQPTQKSPTAVVWSPTLPTKPPTPATQQNEPSQFVSSQPLQLKVTPPSTNSPRETPKEPPFKPSTPKVQPQNLPNWPDLKKGAPLVWKKSDFWECAPRYRKLIALLGDNLEFCSCVCEGIDSTEQDQFSKVIVNIFSQIGRTLPLIRELLEGEFKNVKSSKGSILRGNSVTSKVETAYTRKIGTQYLRSILGDYISKLISDPELDLEIDPRKVSPDVLPKHIEQLKMHCKEIFDRLTSPSSIEKMPREIRAIAGYTAEYAKIYAPDQLKPLIGSFYMLRFVSPAVVTPEGFDLIPETAVLSQKARRNLILIAKVLQNLSNGLKFDKKEEFMRVMNDLLDENIPKMGQFLLEIATDPLARDGKLPWEDFTFAPFFENNFDIRKFDLTDLFILHRALYNNHQRIKQRVMKRYLENQPVIELPVTKNPSGHQKQQSLTTTPENNHHFTPSTPSDRHTLIRSEKEIQIGRKPSLTKAVSNPNLKKAAAQQVEVLHSALEQLKKWETIWKRNVRSSCRFGSSLKELYEQFTILLNEMGHPPVIARHQSAPESVPDLDMASFFYAGAPAKNGNAVFYLIVSRLNLQLLDRPDLIVTHIVKTIDKNTMKGTDYILVVDMSWVTISVEFQRRLIPNIPTLLSFPKEYKKRLKKILLVHSTYNLSAIFHFIREFPKTLQKLHELRSWRGLTEFIAEENIQLPESSKNFITKAYRVIKVNARGRHQERLIKFTANSFLNIDPKSRCVQNERLMSDIEEISCTSDTELIVKFSSNSLNRQKSGLVKRTNKDELDVRKYICQNKLDRDSIIEDIFTVCFNREYIKYSGEYKVIKVNKVGRHQERTFKFTCDSMLNLDNNKIKTEISFAGIEYIKEDPTDDRVIYFKYKLEPQGRKIISKNKKERDELYRQLTDIMALYQQEAIRQLIAAKDGVIDYYSKQL